MGRCLRADVLVDTLTRPTGPWAAVDVAEAIDSTNAESQRDPLAWRLVVAGEQTAGRGRHARAWSSPPGTSVSMSMTVPLPRSPQNWGWLPLVTGLAVRDALAGHGSVDVTLKWPNDVLVRAGEPQASRKVCGILCETAGEQLVVAGIGVNVSVPPDDLPVATATSLHAAGLEVTREEVVVSIARAFAARQRDWGSGGAPLARLRQAYREACSTIGVRVEVHAPADERIIGVAAGVDDDGRLIVDTATGVRVFSAGDVTHVRPS